MVNVYIGLDGEMTGTAQVIDGVPQTPRLCQIGVALGAKDSFGSDIGWQVGDYTYENESLKVNGFSHRRITDGPPPAEVDEQLYQWLIEREFGPRSAIPVGFAVGTFDMPFVRDTLPKSAALFSRRSVDLTGICAMVEQARKVYAGNADPKKLAKWKAPARALKDYAAEILGTENWHDAEYDAIAAILGFKYIYSEIGRALFE